MAIPRIGLRAVGSIPTIAVLSPGALADDYFFELSSGALQPLDSITDFSSIWDLDGDGNITPADAPTDEGYFQTDTDGNIEPTS